MTFILFKRKLTVVQNMFQYQIMKPQGLPVIKTVLINQRNDPHKILN